MSREKFEYEAGKALNLPTNIIELARKGDGYDHAFDSMNIMQPLNGWWHWWKAGAASMQSERDQLAAQLADVVAENAGLNVKMDKLATWPGIEFYSSSWEFNNGDGNEALEFMCDTQTPATDRFLAEQRAIGVDKCASEIQKQTWDESEGDGIVAALDAMEIYAAQLRNEVKV